MTRHSEQRSMLMSRIFNSRPRTWTLAALCLASVAACARNPVTGKRELSLVSESQEIEMGRQAAQQVQQTMAMVDNQELQSYVSRVGTTIAKTTQRPNLPWEFHVVDDPTPNAFALPGGFIFVTRGLLNLMTSEAELATVLGHEIGHVTARHSVQQISQQQLAQVGLGIGMVLSPTLRNYGQLAGAGLQLLFLKYSRDDERQADSLGFFYSLNTNYDVRQMADVFAALQRETQLSKQSPIPNFLATHPDPGERVKTAQQRVAQLNRSLDNTKRGLDEYMKQVNGLVYGEDPRNGFFEGSTFYHPDMRFKVNFPQGWQTQNTSDAVLAGSPQQDAVIQLTLAQGTDPNSAAQQFLSQQGIQAGQTTSENINGMPAVASTFQAQTQQGVVRGLATFISYGGRTFQMLGYSGAQQFDQYGGVFRQTAATFSAVNDPRVLNVQPNRMQVVRLDRSMTLAEFNQQHPSVIPIEELAIINQVESASSTVPAGTYLKQVMGGQAKGS